MLRLKTIDAMKHFAHLHLGHIVQCLAEVATTNPDLELYVDSQADLPSTHQSSDPGGNALISYLINEGGVPNQLLHDVESAYSADIFLIQVTHKRVMCGESDDVGTLLIDDSPDECRSYKLVYDLPNGKQFLLALNSYMDEYDYHGQDCETPYAAVALQGSWLRAALALAATKNLT